MATPATTIAIATRGRAAGSRIASAKPHRDQRDRVVVPGHRQHHERRRDRDREAREQVLDPQRREDREERRERGDDHLADPKRARVQAGGLAEQRDGPEVARIHELRARAGPHDRDVVHPELDATKRKAHPNDQEPRDDRGGEHSPIRAAAVRPCASRDPEQQRRGMQLGDRDDRDGRACRHERQTRRPGEDRQHQGSVRQRVPDVEVAEQDGDGERKEERRHEHRLATNEGAAGLPHGVPPGDLGADVPEPSGRGEPPEDEDHAVGQPRNQGHRLRHRRRVRVEEVRRRR